MDYWDYLGWKDPYGSKKWSQRQTDYCRKMKSRSRYTPMMVTQGTSHTSNRGRATREWETILKEKPRVSLTVTPSEKDGKITIKASAKKLRGADIPAGATVYCAIAEDDIETFCPRGENKGKTLKEGSIVRVLLEGKKVGPKIEWKTDAGDGWKVGNLRAVVFVQDSDTLKVIEAAQAKFGTK